MRLRGPTGPGCSTWPSSARRRWRASGGWWSGPVAAAIGSDAVEGLVAVAYPAGDVLVMFALATAMFGRVRSVPSMVLVLLGVGLACNMVADLTYARLALEGSYPSGGWLDVAYTTGLAGAGLRGTGPGPRLAGRQHALQHGSPAAHPRPALSRDGAHLRTRRGVREGRRRRPAGARRGRHRGDRTRERSPVPHVPSEHAPAGTASPQRGTLPGDPAQRLGCRRRGRPAVAPSPMPRHRRRPSSPASRPTQSGAPSPSSCGPRTRRSCASCCAAAGERAGSSGTIACRSSSTPPRDLEVGVVNLLANELVAGLVVTFRDVTERLAFEGELRARALHDPLTGLANRVLFNDRLDQALRRARRRRTRPAVLYLDLDSLQGRQRHARPHDRRRGPRGGRPTPADRPASRGHGRAAGRRRVRCAHRGHRGRQRGDRRRGAHPPGAGRALHHRRS